MLLFDENLSFKLVAQLADEFPDSQAVVGAAGLGEGASDESVWEYAKTNNLVLVTKDKDFVNYWQRFGPPPKVIKLEIGNCRLHAIESILKNNKYPIMHFIAGNAGLLVLTS